MANINVSEARQEALVALYGFIKRSADEKSELQPEFAQAINSICYSCVQLEGIETTKDSNQALLNMYKILETCSDKPNVCTDLVSQAFCK